MTEKDTKQETEAVASDGQNAELEHTAGGATTRDAMDAGVPMIAGDPQEPVGPEDAMGPGPKRGDYSDRLSGGPSMRTQVIPQSERLDQAKKIAKASDGGLTVAQALGEVPQTRLVPAGADPVGDEPGKGGVPGTVARDVPLPEAS